VPSFTHLRYFKIAKFIWSCWNLRCTFNCTIFNILSVTPMNLCYLYKLKNFNLYQNKNKKNLWPI
jgi:hypothetical protein